VTETVDLANIRVHVSRNLRGMLRIHVEGSGPFVQRPMRLNDWLRTNALAFIVVGVHLGYLVAAIRVLWRFRHEIRAASWVTITGHSLGGATAEVAAVLGSVFLGGGIRGESYGGPAPWWFVTWPLWWLVSKVAGAELAWYVAGGDPVPLLPFFWNRHLGQRHWIHGTGDGPIADHVHGYDALIEA
jgi:hypothetical protein